jgi:hypothetical protein
MPTKSLATTVLPTSVPVHPSVTTLSAAQTGTSAPTTAPNFGTAIGVVGMDMKLANRLSALVDNLSLGLGPGIISGFALSSTGLNVTVGVGIGIMGGLFEFAAQTRSLPANQSHVWLWVNAAGSLEYTTGSSSAPPAGNFLLVGHCVTGASALTGSFDVSGVIYIIGGMSWRETNNANAPGDTLDANLRIWTKTQDGVYLWTGVAHVKMS